jgi:carbonic anhydrase
VQAEVEWLRSQPTVAKAIAERGLKVHAFVFDKEEEACVRLVEEGGEATGGAKGVVA